MRIKSIASRADHMAAFVRRTIAIGAVFDRTHRRGATPDGEEHRTGRAIALTSGHQRIGVVVDREFWNSQAAEVCPGEDVAAAVVAIGRLHEMVASFLSHSPERRSKLQLVSEAFEGSFDQNGVQRLYGRRDFPLVC